MPLEVILLDLDETLVVEHGVVDEAFLVTCKQANEKYGCDPRELSQAVRSNARRLWHSGLAFEYCSSVGISSWEGLGAYFLGDDPNLDYLRKWAPNYRRRSWFQALAEFGIQDLEFAEKLGEIFINERRKKYSLFPEVQDLLQALRSKYRLGLVTNGPPDLQKEKIGRTGIGKFFDNILISGEIGIGKPDARLFNLALARFSVEHTKVVMVGDSLERDIQGAHNVGIRGVWINRIGVKAENQEIVPDYEIGNLEELVSILE